MGPHMIHYEKVVSQVAAAPAPTATNTLGSDPCSIYSKAFQDVHRNDVSSIILLNFSVLAGLIGRTVYSTISVFVVKCGFRICLDSHGILPSHAGAQQKYGEDAPGGERARSTAIHSNDDAAQVSAGMQCDVLMDNMRIQEMEYEDGNGNMGLLPLDPSLMDIDIDSLQVYANLHP